jgi:hypothetical protein
MFRYFYERDGQTHCDMFPSLGRALDASLMDFSSGQTKPTKVQDAQYRDIMDYHDLHWLYSRTWNAEYDRVTGAVVARG